MLVYDHIIINEYSNDDHIWLQYPRYWLFDRESHDCSFVYFCKLIYYGYQCQDCSWSGDIGKRWPQQNKRALLLNITQPKQLGSP